MNWFKFIERSVQAIKSRLSIEFIPGEVTSILEQIRNDLVAHCPPSDPKAEVQNGSKETTSTVSGTKAKPSKVRGYPRIYDKILLSNIPDYIGGTLLVSL